MVEKEKQEHWDSVWETLKDTAFPIGTDENEHLEMIGKLAFYKAIELMERRITYVPNKEYYGC